MYRAIPESNRLVCQRQIQQAKAVHHIKLRTVLRTVNNTLPVSLAIHTSSNPKEHALEGKNIYLLDCNNS